MDDTTPSQAATPDATPSHETATPANEQPRAADGKFAAKDAQPTGEQPDATAEHVETDANTAEPSEKDEPQKPRSRAVERINELTAQKRAAEREAAFLRQRLEQMVQARAPDVDPNDYEGMQREGLRQVFREESAQQTAQQYQEAVRRSHQATVDSFNAKIDAARERIPDIDRSIQDFMRLPVSQHAGEIIAESEFSAEIAHYLSRNPREAMDLYGMTPAQQGRALARIEAKFELPARKTTKAPQPPPSVTGAASANVKAPSEMTFAEYEAWRIGSSKQRS